MDDFDRENDVVAMKRPHSDDTTLPKKKMKQPTVEELNELNETQTLFKNNLFRLQISELLSETKIKNKYKLKLTSWLNDFQIFLNTLPVHDAINISNFSKQAKTRPSRDLRFIKNLINNCKNNLRCDQDIPITFLRPESMATFGLYKIDCLPGPYLNINLHLTIPKKCLNEKDYLNNRYFVKKFYYLMYIADHLKTINIASSIKCGYLNENIMLPYLIITPLLADKITINLFLIPEQGCFKLNRVLPDQNNVKMCEIFEKEFGKIENLRNFPTSFYNASLAFDFTLNENNLFIEELLNDQNIKDGLKLIVIWMNRKKFNEGLGSFTNDVIVYLILYMLVKKKINKHMSSYQIFRNFLNFFINTDLTQTVLSINETVDEDILIKFKNTFDIVILDKTGYFNVASFINVEVYKKMKYECQLAFTTLDEDSLNGFSNLFLMNVPQFVQYDGIIDIKSDNNFQSLLETSDSSLITKYLGHYPLLIMKLLQNYLNIGLSKRVVNLVPFVNEKSTWDYGLRYNLKNPRILFGVLMDPDCAFDILEMGPMLNDPKEKEFREFWGKLASNRRFRDGTAKVVVHFDTKTIKDKREIMKKIINHVLREKLKLNFKFYYDDFEELLLNKRVNSWYPMGTNEETSVKIIRASDELGKKIRSLDMQLGISGIRGISDVFCYTNVFPQIPTVHHSGKYVTNLIGHNIILKERKIHAAPKYVEPIQCVIQLEHSSKWPNELEAFEKMKILFYFQISKLLNEKFRIISTVKNSHIDVLYEGLVFRYHLHISKEIGLLKKTLKENNLVTYKDTEISLEIEKKIVILPQVVSALIGVQSQYPSYGIGTCLAKRWIRSQLIDDFLLPDIVIDLLVAKQFTGYFVYTPGISPQVVFLRFLKFLTEIQSEIEPVVVNFNNELNVEQITKFDNELRLNREKFPSLTVLTPYDVTGTVFTRNNPSKEVMKRLNILAKECLNLIEKVFIDQSLIDVKELFVANTDGFDCLIHLKSMINPRRHENIQRINEMTEDSKINFLEPTNNDEIIPVIDFNPIQLYLRELRESYGDFCVFFYDIYGGNFIGVLWNPKELEKKDVKLSYILGRKIEKNKLILDIKEIVKGFKILGKDIVKSIELKNDL